MRIHAMLSLAVVLLAGQALETAAGQGLTLTVNDATFQPETNGGTGLLSFGVSMAAVQDPTNADPEEIPTGTQVTLIWSTGDVSARGGASCGAGVDYLAQSQVGLTVSAAQPNGQINVPICGDTRDEANETFNVILSVSSGSATLARNTATGTIVDDDPAPTISVGAAQQVEGNSGTTTLAVPVVLSTPSERPVTANFQTEVTGLTATQASNCTGGADLQLASGQVSIAEGVDRGVANVSICGDVVAEPNQTFRVRLTGATNASLATASSAIGTILNDDATFSVNDVTVTEPVSGTKTVRFTVSLSSTSSNEVRVSYRTTDGTARSTGSGSGPWNCSMIDFFPVSGTLPIPANATSGFVDVSVCGGDARGEPNQVFYLDLSAPVGTTIADARGVATIKDAFPSAPKLRLP
jgi:hypothetical protein